MSNLPGWQNPIVCTGADCNFGSLIKLISVMVNDITVLATYLVVIACIYIGFKLMTSGGSEAVVSDAKARAWKILLGYLWILLAWVIVYTITHTLLGPGYSLLQ